MGISTPASRWLARGEDHLPADDCWLSAGERARAADLRFTKRRTEYLVARWTVKQAVARVLGVSTDPPELARVEVRNATTGAPVAYWDGTPADLGISLTDRAGWAVCLVGPPSGAVGCDLELVEPRSPAFVQDYLTPAEQRAVLDAGSGEVRPEAANLIWSAKESALKVLQTGLRRDTRSVEVNIDPGPARDGWSALTIRSVDGAEFPGWWRRHGAFLLTVAFDSPCRPPESIEDPPALAAAIPTHSWLSRPVSCGLPLSSGT